jgi:hypothetical protein
VVRGGITRGTVTPRSARGQVAGEEIDARYFAPPPSRNALATVASIGDVFDIVVRRAGQDRELRRGAMRAIPPRVALAASQQTVNLDHVCGMAGSMDSPDGVGVESCMHRSDHR